jgi:hypothetical protein
VAALALLEASQACAVPRFLDPQGDTFGAAGVAHDIVFVDSQLGASSLSFAIGFHEPVSPPSAFAANSVAGFIDIDIDQNKSTGAKSNKSRLGRFGDASLGIEYYVDLFSERFSPGMAEVVNAATMQVAGVAPVRYDVRSLQVEVPLRLIANDGLVNYGVIVGNFIEGTDEGRNVGESVAFSVPEPTCAASLILCVAGLLLGGGRFKKRPVYLVTLRSDRQFFQSSED